MITLMIAFLYIVSFFEIFEMYHCTFSRVPMSGILAFSFRPFFKQVFYYYLFETPISASSCFWYFNGKIRTFPQTKTQHFNRKKERE